MQESRFLKAVKLTNSGLKKEALVLFQELLMDDPADERAWLWLVECLETRELRMRALETCLRINPGASRAQAALSALQMGSHFATPNADQPLIAITGGDAQEMIEHPVEEKWMLSGGASVFTVSPEVISPEEVAEREARVYDLLPYRMELQEESNPWEDLQETGDRLTEAPINRRRRRYPFSERMSWAASQQERQLSIAYSTLAVLVVALLVILLMGTGSFGY